MLIRAAITLAVLLAATATAQVLEEVGRLACGPPESVSLAHGVGCRSDGGALIISDAGSGDELSRLDLGHSIRSQARDGDLLYASTLDRTMVAVDLADPTQPQIIWEIGARDWCADLEVLGHFLIAGNATYGLSIYDLSLATPDEVVWWYEPEYVVDIELVGSLAYLACIDYGLYVMDLADPSAPEVLWHDTRPRAYGVAVADERLVVPLYDEVAIFGLADPLAPVELGHLPLRARQPVAYGRHVVLGDYTYAVTLIDPVAMEVLGSTPMPSYVSDLCVDGDLALAAVPDADTYLIDLAAAGGPAVVHTDPATGQPEQVAVHGGLALVSTDRPSLMVMEYGDDGPQPPQTIVELEAPVIALDHDGLRAVLAEAGGVRAVDLADPGAPVIGPLFNLAFAPRAVALDGSRANVACGAGGLVTIDVSDVQALEQWAFAAPLGEFEDVAVRDGIAYVAAGAAGLRVYDTTAGGTMFPIGVLGGQAGAVALDGSLLVLAASYDLRTVDVAEPTSPQLLGTLDFMFWLDQLTLGHGVAYVRANMQDILCVELTWPETPTIVGTFDGPHLVEAYEADGDLLVSTWPATGVIVLRNLIETSVPIPSGGPTPPVCSPNPGNPRIGIDFAIAAGGSVRLEITDLRGRRLRTLVHGELPAGPHRRTWDGRDDSGQSLPSGVYLVLVTSAAGMSSGRVTLVR